MNQPAERSALSLPQPPAEAVTYLGPQLGLMQRYVGHLADTGVSHGLIGPREVPRLWQRHVLNCAVVADLLPVDASVIDIGSGAGLPGLVLAVTRPDLRLTLVEPLLRRVNWLDTVVADLSLDNVTVVRSRAEEQWGLLEADVVTARAVAALDKLARWSLPLVRNGGQMLALKGSSAQEELDAVGDLSGWSVTAADVVEVGQGVVDPPTIVTRLRLVDDPRAGSLARPRKARTARSAKSTSRSARRTMSDRTTKKRKP